MAGTRGPLLTNIAERIDARGRSIETGTNAVMNAIARTGITRGQSPGAAVTAATMKERTALRKRLAAKDLGTIEAVLGATRLPLAGDQTSQNDVFHLVATLVERNDGITTIAVPKKEDVPQTPARSPVSLDLPTIS